MIEPLQLFDAAAFAASVKAKLQRDALSVREVQRQTGVHYSTVYRVSNGAAPNVETYFRLAKWLGRKRI